MTDRSEHKREVAEAEEMKERGTLTPEGEKQGVTSHLPVGEMEEMYQPEEEEGAEEKRRG